MQIAHYQALRSGAGVIGTTDRGWVAVTGAERAEFLQGLLTNDVVALAPGRGCYAACLMPNGRLIADMHVRIEADRIVLDLHAGVTDRIRKRLDAGIFTEDVVIADLTPETAACDLHGPDAGAVAAQVAGGALPAAGLALNGHCAFRLDGQPAVAARLDPLGIEGYRLLIGSGGAEALRQALAAAGAVAVTPEACETVRVESGRPVFPVDMDQETIPLEAGIMDRAIDFNKGCYVGQEVIVRILHRGQGRVARRLVGLTLDAAGGQDGAARGTARGQDGAASGAAGAPVRSTPDAGGAPGNAPDGVPDATTPDGAARGGDAGPDVAVPKPDAAIRQDGKRVGRVTSAAHSPTLGTVVALGYVPRALADAPGAEVAVTANRRRVRAVITPLPFVPPPRGRS